MKSMNAHAILLDILRIGLISIRSLVTQEKRGSDANLMLVQWSQLCHSLPLILIGDCDSRAITFFVEGDGLIFRRDFPSKDDAYYLQAIEMIDGLGGMG